MKLLQRDSVVAVMISVLVLWLILAGCTDVTPTPTEAPLPTPGSPLATPPISPLVPAVVEFPVSKTMEDEPMNDFLQVLLDFCISAGLPLVLGMCAVDIGVGVGAALKSKEFDWRKLGDFYLSQILALFVPYVAVLAMLALVPGLADFVPAAIAPAVLFASIMAKLTGSIIANAGKLNIGS